MANIPTTSDEPPGHENLAGTRRVLDKLPEQIGPYRILERLGGGGMGELYRAEQRSPIRREVAIKLIKLGMDTKLVIARFEAERQALAMMDHPHIAKVFDADSDNTGRPYFVMEYVKGKPITEYADQNHLTIHERLELFEQVCYAIQHAHHKGVIHRDLKPGNVLVSTQDGKPFAKVIDFGIAKAISHRLTEKTLYTQHEQFIGTPQYMSPEQADGSLDIDTRTDVYSLGVLLYELLTGTTPFALDELRAAAMDKIVQMIRDIEPPKPSTRLSSNTKTLPTLAASRRTEPKKLGSLIRGELDWIVMKAMEKDRARRYDTPNNLSDDIHRYLTGQSVKAAPPSMVYLSVKFARRHRRIFVAVAAVLVVLVGGIIGMSLMYLHAESLRRIAQHNEGEANHARMDAEASRVQAIDAKSKEDKSFYDASILAIDKSISESLLDRAQEMLDDCPPQYKNWEWGRLNYLCHLYLFHLNRHERSPSAVVFNSSGTLLAASGHECVELWNPLTGELVRTLAGNVSSVGSLAFSPNGNILAAGGGGRYYRWEDHPSGTPKSTSIHLWNTKSGVMLGQINGHSQTVASLAFSPDGRMLVSAGLDGETIFWDPHTLKEIHRLPKSSGEVRSIAFSPDGKLLACAGWNDAGTFDVWDTTTFSLIKTLGPSGGGTPAVSFSPDGKLLAAGGKDGVIYFFDSHSFALVKSMRAAEYFIWSLTWHPTKPLLLVASRTGASLLSLDDGTVHELPGIAHEATSVAFDLTGNYAAVCCFGEKSLWVYDLRKLQTAMTLEAVEKMVGDGPWQVSNISLTHHGDFAAAAIGCDSYVPVWDTASGEEILKIGPHPQFVSSVAFSPDDTRLATTSDVARIWDLATGSYITLQCDPNGGTTWGCFSHDGNLFATTDRGGMVRIWDAHTGNMRMALDQHAQSSIYLDSSKATCACFSPDDKVLAVSTSGPINLWDVKSGQELRSFGKGAYALRIAFSPDGKLIVSGSQANQPSVWNVASGQLLFQLEGHRQGTWAVAFSPDGSRIATASLDHNVRIWDTSSHREELSMQGNENLNAVAFSADGLSLASGAANTVTIWPALSWKKSQIVTAPFATGSYMHSYLAAVKVTSSSHPHVTAFSLVPPPTYQK